MYKHFIAIFLCGLTTTSWASNTCFSRMSDGVGMPTAVSSIKSQLALLSRKAMYALLCLMPKGGGTERGLGS